MQRKHKRLLIGTPVLLILAGLVGVVVLVGGIGQSPIEAWIGERVKAVAAEQLKPTLQFDTLDYQAPLTVELSGVRLTADDPERPGQRVHIVQANTLRLDLAELPREGRPLKLAAVGVDSAVVRLIELQDGGMLGFSDLMRDTGEDKKTLLSDVLQISELAVRDTIIEYDTRQPGTQPMRLDRIDTVVNIDPGDGGAYGIDLALDRDKVFALDLQGELDLDAMAVGIESMKLGLTLGREQDRYLPPQVQQLLQTYALTGELAVAADGRIDLNDPFASQASFTLGLTGAHGAVGGYRLPIKALDVNASMHAGVVTIDEFDGRLLGGALDGSGRVGLRGAMPVALTVSGEGLDLEQLLLPDTPGGQPPATGKVSLQASARAPMDRLTTQLAGGGEVRLKEGRVGGLPVISSLIAFMESRGDLERLEGKGTDTGHIVFELRGDHAYLSQTDIDASWFAMRGRGKVFFDERVAMNVNAGPMAKLQNATGAVGRLLGGVTDRALVYRVRGKMDELSIVPVPLGGLVGAPGDDESADDFLESPEP